MRNLLIVGFGLCLLTVASGSFLGTLWEDAVQGKDNIVNVLGTQLTNIKTILTGSTKEIDAAIAKQPLATDPLSAQVKSALSDAKNAMDEGAAVLESATKGTDNSNPEKNTVVKALVDSLAELTDVVKKVTESGVKVGEGAVKALVTAVKATRAVIKSAMFTVKVIALVG